MNGSAFEIILAVIVGLISVFCIATAVVGYFLKPLGVLTRVIMAASGLLLMYQSMLTNLIGMVLLIGVYLLMKRKI